MKTEIEKFNPCIEALEFREKHKTFDEAWKNCKRGDWMLWIASKLKIDDRVLTFAKSQCAKTVLHLMKDKRSVKAINDCERYYKGEMSREELNSSAYAAAYAAADADAAYAAAYAAADAADAYAAAAAAAYAAAYAAADAADAYAYAAADADAADAKKDNQLETSNICRKILTKSVMEKINELKSK